MKTLVAVDLSHEPERLVDLAAQWVSRAGGVMDLAYVDPVATIGPLVKQADLARSVRAQIRHLSDEHMKALEALNKRVPYDCRGVVLRLEGETTAEICAKGTTYDLVAVGSHGRRGVERFLLGSIAERIVRTSKTPVIVLRDPPREVRARILCAVDLRDRAQDLVDSIRNFVIGWDAVVDLAYVEENAAFVPFNADAVVQTAVTEYESSRRRRVEEDLFTLLERLPPPYRGLPRMEFGVPASEISRWASSYDLLITGTHGRTGFDRWWTGSVAEEVVRTCSRSVLVRRLPTEELVAT